MLDAAGMWLQQQALDGQPGPVLRVALDLGLAALQRHIEHEFMQV